MITKLGQRKKCLQVSSQVVHGHILCSESMTVHLLILVFAQTLTYDSVLHSLFYVERAMINFYAENMDLTQSYLDSSIAYYSNNDLAYKLRGSYYRGQGKFQLALSDIDNSLRKLTRMMGRPII